VGVARFRRPKPEGSILQQEMSVWFHEIPVSLSVGNQNAGRDVIQAARGASSRRDPAARPLSPFLPKRSFMVETATRI
ncbi:MAG: hypothetical protein ACREEP_00700, partial [Dongiaceae bacterium]